MKTIKDLGPETLRAAKPFRAVQRAGFTLIELLVVVLIIGILSAVALPQYEKVVWKSRAAEMMASTKSLGQAQELYYMANSSWPGAFSDLDIDFSSLPENDISTPCGMGSTGAAGLRKKGFMTLSLNRTDRYNVSGAAFNEGPYKCGGFVYVHYSPDAGVAANHSYCWQYVGGTADSAGFCRKLFNGEKAGFISGWDVYRF